MTENGLKPLLLEIGTEEIPSRFLPAVIAQIKEIAEKVFAEYRLSCEEMSSYATPRRIVLMVGGIPPLQRDVSREVFGPAKKAAFDDRGNPTKAATGFASSLGLKPEDLVIKTKGKGEYVAALIEEKGAETAAVMPDVMKKIVSGLHFPKAMRWGDGSMTFVRPIRWLLSVFGADVVPFEMDGIKSGAMSRGHRFLSPASFQIRDISAFSHILENNFVILSQEKRANIIRDGIENMARSVHGLPLMDEDLLTTVTFLVEYPVPVLCSFDREYLKLPKELLVTVMKDHQKYFAVSGEDGRLVNSFVVISNTKAANAETVKIGAERVLRARFDDAKFYYHEDRKQTLESRLEELKRVTFHDELGSLYQKTERIVSLNSYLAERLVPELKDSRAALLSKTDLITGVVREFPELQGVMGRYYAQHDGEEAAVARAIEEQYLPKSYGQKPPSTDAGALLSLSDKADNVASFFSIGLVPSGSEDPFALRRQAIGIVSIIVDRGYDITIDDLFKKAIEPSSAKSPKDQVLADIFGFMEQRIEFVFSQMGYAPDLIKSVLPLAMTLPLKSLTGRMDALQRFRQDEAFPDFLLAIKRVNNITPKTTMPPVNADLLKQDEEKELHKVFSGIAGEIAASLREEKFYGCLQALARITGPVNGFFDKVLVMDKQEEIKNNRLALLKEIWQTASSIADFSRLS